MAELGELAEGRLPGRHVEAREAVALEAEIDRAGGGDLAGVGQALRPGPGRGRVGLGRGRIGRRQAEQLGLRLEVRLAVRPAQVGQRLERPAVADRA